MRSFVFVIGDDALGQELENIIKRAAAQPHDAPEAGDGEVSAGSTIPFLPTGMSLPQYEEELFREALRRTKGNQCRAARLLGIPRNMFRYRLSKLKVP